MVVKSDAEFHWSGPGLVVALASNHRSVWVSVRGYLVKASREQVRLATSEENIGVELAEILSNEMLEKLNQASVKHYKDIQEEGGPLAAEAAELQDLERSPTNQSPESAIPTTSNLQEPDTEVEYSPSIADADMQVDEPSPMTGQEADNGQTARDPVFSLEEGGSTRTPSVPSSRRPSSLGSVRVDEGSFGTMRFGPIRQSSSAENVAMPYPWTQPMPSMPTPPGRSMYLEVVITKRMARSTGTTRSMDDENQ